MNKTRIQIAKHDIEDYFDNHVSSILKLTEIQSVLSSNRDFWRLAQRTNTQQFIKFLIENSKLKKLNFPFPYRAEIRYVWGDVPLLEVLLTLKKDAYFSHYTAVRMHGLSEQVSHTVYLNHEQRPQPQNSHLEQGRIDAAFSRKPRISQNSIELEDMRVCMINGMFTNQLGVISDLVSYNENSKIKVRLTNLERTLIDITVRPAYSGGLFEVQKAFRLAKDNLSVNTLAAMLQKMKFVYPYHQAIGYYLENSGYKSIQLDLLRRFPMEHDFYLGHNMGETEYVKEWRLHVPKGF